ncbi:nitroreductase family protein [Tumidithrix elongata RA019]|uniref:Nitroreductase family protein n=1 Tax=Tumidithrix elongata BACA0141 TaxID=2716417 RepID=A0AAW9Q7Q9_9CYAN|nr:nitroreductase family protein [Tumidithrix elongata RA019]
MEKPAVTDFEIHDAIAQRWSPRAFDRKPVEAEKLNKLFEAARWSASCFNDQPWNFIVATQTDTIAYQQLLDCLVPANIVWAQAAPVLILAVARKAFKHNGKPNDWAEYDCGQAVATLSVQATSMGLVLHQMAGFMADKAIATFKLPENFKPMAAIALGYPGELSSLPPDLQAKETATRDRYPLSSFVFTGEWGKHIPFA